MAEDHALEPQLKEFLVQSGLIHNLGDDSGIPVERLRAGYESAFTSVPTICAFLVVQLVCCYTACL